MAFDQIAVSGLYPRERYEVKMGVNAQLGKGWAGWMNVGHQWGQQDFRSVIYRVGAKFSW